jgi:hypothetical protein
MLRTRPGPKLVSGYHTHLPPGFQHARHDLAVPSYIGTRRDGWVPGNQPESGQTVEVGLSEVEGERLCSYRDPRTAHDREFMLL